MKMELIDNSIILTKLREENPSHNFRISGNNIQREFSNRWKTICKHNRVKYRCADCGGTSMCEHKKRKSQCVECNGSSICEHKKHKYMCKECNGSSFCIHNIIKSLCKTCDGHLLCEHDKRKYKCKKCKGGLFCEHSKIKSLCILCEGKSLCEHKIDRSRCVQCLGKRICQNCKERHIRKGILCVRCQPDFVQTKKGCSKIACEFLDILENELNTKIQHLHFNPKDKTIEGSEHRPIKWRKKSIDGYYINEQNQQVAIEFLGDYFHGHPRLWNNEHVSNHFNNSFELLFKETEKKLCRLLSHNYIVLYIWESDFKKFKKTGEMISLLSKCRSFKGQLEH